MGHYSESDEEWFEWISMLNTIEMLEDVPEGGLSEE